MVAWLSRTAGFTVVGLLTFRGLPSNTTAANIQIVGYCLIGLGLVVWALLDLYPAAAPYSLRVLPTALGVIAVVAGFSATTGGSGSIIVAFAAVATMGAGSELSQAEGLTVTAAGVLAIEVGEAIYNQGYGTLLGLPLLLISALLIGRNRAAFQVQAEQAAALLAQYERLQAEQRRADVLDERTRIAREIHDVLAHSLGALSIQIQAARAVLTDQKDVDRAVDILTTAQRMAADGLVETRRAVHALRVDTLPLNEELARTIESYAQRYSVAVTFDTGGSARPLPPDATVALLRTAQEALVNAAKHAEGQPVTARLDYTEHEVRLTVVNDLTVSRPIGPARASTLNGGYGLTGMQERLRLLNGTLEAGPHEGRWTVTAVLPLAPAPRPEKLAP